MRIPGFGGGDIMLDGDATTGTQRGPGAALEPKRMTSRERSALRKSLASQIAATGASAEVSSAAVENAIQEIEAGVSRTAASLAAADAAAAEAAREGELALQAAEAQAAAARSETERARLQEELTALAAAEAERKAAADKALAELDAKARAAAAAAAKAQQEAEAKAAEAAAKAAAAIAAAEKAAKDAAAAAEKAAKDAAAAADKAAKEAAAKAKADAEAAAKAAAEAKAKAEAELKAAQAASAALAASGNINVTGNVPLTPPGPYGTAIGPASQADILAAKMAEENARLAKEEARQSVITTLTERFSRYGLQSLVPKIKDLAVIGASEATVSLQLQETEEYRQRFIANQARIKSGLAALSPGEYLAAEDGYRQILRAYGLNNFATDQYVQQFIENDVSASELSNRVATAVQRVQNSDPAVMKTLKDYYGIGEADAVAYILDPSQQISKIQRQVAAAEIGAAARVQGIEAGVGVAEQLAAQGITQAEARKGYSTIADILPTAEKLSQIYGEVETTYGLAEAEQEVFNQLASAQRRRERLTRRELAQFSGQSGLGRTSLTSLERGQF